MKTVQAIIDALGGMDHLKDHPIRLMVPGYMALCVEYIGDCGPRGGAVVSVMHTFLQNGDVMRDPDLVCEVKDGVWSPLSYQQDSLGLFQLAVSTKCGKVVIRPKLLADLQRFSRQWNRNLKDQGFLTAALETVGQE